MLGQSGAEWTFLLSKGTSERSHDVFLGGLIGSREALYDSMSMVATSGNLVVCTGWQTRVATAGQKMNNMCYVTHTVKPYGRLIDSVSVIQIPHAKPVLLSS